MWWRPLWGIWATSPCARWKFSRGSTPSPARTRHARRLLDHYSIAAPTFALHQHNEREAGDKLVLRLQRGESVALISDAGTPASTPIPAPEWWRRCRRRVAPVIPLPGPSAAIRFFSSGLADQRFLFVGFLPAKAAARRRGRSSALPRCPPRWCSTKHHTG